jgi:hypothetical protein
MSGVEHRWIIQDGALAIRRARQDGALKIRRIHPEVFKVSSAARRT